MKCITRHELIDGDRRTPPGERITLDKAEADRLIALGAVAPDDADESSVKPEAKPKPDAKAK